MSEKLDVLRGQSQALTAFSFTLVHGMVAGGLLSAREMREIIEAADAYLPEGHHPIAAQMLALMISAIPED